MFDLVYHLCRVSIINNIYIYIYITRSTTPWRDQLSLLSKSPFLFYLRRNQMNLFLESIFSNTLTKPYSQSIRHMRHVSSMLMWVLMWVLMLMNMAMTLPMSVVLISQGLQILQWSCLVECI